jgi:hypothetical protein
MEQSEHATRVAFIGEDSHKSVGSSWIPHDLLIQRANGLSLSRTFKPTSMQNELFERVALQ